MTLGKTGTGKSICYEILIEALALLVKNERAIDDSP
jgi:hypothetical protein